MPDGWKRGEFREFRATVDFYIQRLKQESLRSTKKLFLIAKGTVFLFDGLTLKTKTGDEMIAPEMRKAIEKGWAVPLDTGDPDRIPPWVYDGKP